MTTTDNKTDLPAGRKPAQKRGRERVQRILDAAEQLICEHGTEGVTIQALSKQSGTSVGSIYHFFRDMQAIFVMLKERYDEKITGLLTQIIDADPPAVWQQRSAQDFITAIFTPYTEFLLANRAFMPVTLACGLNYRNSAFLQLLISILKLRQPDWPEEKVQFETHFMHATALGIIQQSFLRDTAMAYAFLPRIIGLLVWHLGEIEGG